MTEPVDCIHDLLSIGEFEAALTLNKKGESERDRLPLFLRLLSAGQPLSDIPCLLTTTEKDVKEAPTSDPFINAVVSKLEDVAATYSQAESIDILVTHLAPSISKRISKLPPIKRKSKIEWDTEQLLATAQNPLAQIRGKKLRSLANQSDTAVTTESEDNLDEGSCEDIDEHQDFAAGTSIDSQFTSLTCNRSDGRNFKSSSMSEDSVEVHLTRVWTEVATLVAESLRPPIFPIRGGGGGGADEPDEVQPERPLTVKVDSLLSESDITTGDGNDLGACLAVWMYHAPVLRHSHVASAFCQASVPLASTLIYRMGANSPTSIPCLVRGCINAVEVSNEVNETSVITIARDSIRQLARLSPREGLRIQDMLPISLCDLKLELAFESDLAAASCCLIQHLSQRDVLAERLLENSTLLKICYNRLLRSIEGMENLSAEFIIHFQAFTWLIHAVPKPPINHLLDAATTFLKLLKTNSLKGEIKEKPEKSRYDNSIHLLLSSCLLLCSYLASNVETDIADSREPKDSWQGLLKATLSFKTLSLKQDIFCSRIALLLHSQQLQHLQDILNDSLSPNKLSLKSDEIKRGFLKVCKWAVISGNLDELCKKNLNLDAISLDCSALLQMVKLAIIDVQNLDFLMKGVLQDVSRASKFIRSMHACDMLSAAITFLSKKGIPNVPFVTQIQLSELIENAISNVKPDEKVVLHMALNFTYLTLFFEQHPTSPFLFDLRDYAVSKVLNLIKKASLEVVHHKVETILRKKIPDVFHNQENLNAVLSYVYSSSSSPSYDQHHVKNKLSDAVRHALEHPEADPSGVNSERLYMIALQQLPSADVDCLVVGVLLATPHSPYPFLSYGMLCRDPLGVLKLPLSVWKCRGLRRVTLSILERLLVSNEVLCREASPSEQVFGELITSRNVVLLRCLLSLATGCVLSADSNSSMRLSDPCICHVLTGFIRSLVTSQSGLVATLIKHGLPDEVIDWLVDSVPECIRDILPLKTLLTDSTLLTAVERLRIADASIRIAIAFGSRDETEAISLASASLQQLVLSFNLILGPIGVPLNALVDENGLDITQVCRKASFRILHALQKIRGQRIGMKHECSLVLQKLASLCKSESTHSGPSANRRKALLKDIWDMIIKALNAMGSGIILN